MANNFVGRKRELEQLNLLLQKQTASLVVVTGRRRIGKSRLIQEFGGSHQVYTFSGLPPTPQTTMKEQLREFGWQLGKALGEPAFKDDDWNDLFLRLANRTRTRRVIIFLDEISWMGSKDPQFLGKLKNAWDLEFKKNTQLILVLCGSVSSWIEKNILSSTGFVGRVSLTLKLGELPLVDCNSFWGRQSQKISAYEKLKILAVTGGIPKYLEEIQPSLSAEENIKNLCFSPGGFLFNEFDHIFTDIFAKRSEMYTRILEAIIKGHHEINRICDALKIEKSGAFSGYLDDLIQSGFLKRDFTWSPASQKASKLSHYRVSDNYVNFYLKYIVPLKEKIERGHFDQQSLLSLPGWEAIMGLQFENLVLSNRAAIFPLLNLRPDDIIYDNPFFQNKTVRQEACQIDYLIQTRMDSVYACEVKFSKHPIGVKIIGEMEEKLKRLRLPRYTSRRPVLIHVNGVSDELLESQYFSQIIDFSQLLL